jgi:periplasmic protein CpxP/Spy
MSKLKFLTYIIILLVIINIFSIVKMLTSSPNHRQPPKDIIIRKLNLNDSQITEYEKLISKHRNAIDSIDYEINRTKKKLYSKLNLPENNLVSDSLLNVIAKSQLEIEHTHYNHFRDIKSICKPNQIDKYEALTTELNKLFSKPPKPK